MSSKSIISENTTKQCSSSVPQNDSNAHRSNRQNIFNKYYQTLKSIFQRPNFLFSRKLKNSSSTNSEIKQNKLGASPEKTKSNELLLFLLSLGVAMGGISDENILKCEGNAFLICLPCQPKPTEPKKEKKEERKPVGMITQNKEMELKNGKIIFGCLCGKRNGLAGADCPRACCSDNPGCTMVPPQCWPQFKETPEPKPKPKPPQKIICIPIELVFCDSNNTNATPKSC